ncbi:MAG: carboxylating nicotinate-nucleotide diphosphorylase [Actinobacteria bacterium]|nr:MAG: carboxylating nicotinate-nucleotide diphosphorylase [Actinomycetota bacterium]
MLDTPDFDDVVAASLGEDLGVPPETFRGGVTPEIPLLERDATSASVIPAGTAWSGRIVAREDAVVCGLPGVERTYALVSRAAGLAEPVEVFPLVAEGARVAAGTAVAEVSGDARAVLAGERTALNLLMTLSGIATEARRWQEEAGALAVVDTRKTLPGLRRLSKYAVRVGGAQNHRTGLWDMVLVKDNHLRAAGGAAAAVRAARAARPGLLVQVEADSLGVAVQAARAGADLLLLDNMDDAALTEAAAAVREAARDGVVIEASGGIRFERLRALARTGVDRVSTSAITFARPRDFALDEG